MQHNYDAHCEVFSEPQADAWITTCNWQIEGKCVGKDGDLFEVIQK